MKCQREQSLRDMREEKGRELMRKGGKKKQLFFNRLRGHRAGKKETPCCRHPYSLLSLFFLWLFFLILPVFACFSIATSLYALFCLFLLFSCFSIFSFLFPCMFLLVIRLYLFKLSSAREYICIWSRPLCCRCERYPTF
jgi:hypothetical protein